MSKVLLAWLVVIIWCGVIFFLSSRPGLSVAEGYWDFATRKPAHIIAYFILSILIFNALNSTFSNQNKKTLIIFSFLLSLFYGISDEIHQSFVPLREGKISDILFDGFGAGIGIYWIWSFQAHILPKLKKLQKNLSLKLKMAD